MRILDFLEVCPTSASKILTSVIKIKYYSVDANRKEVTCGVFCVFTEMPITSGCRDICKMNGR
jgi:hypothetical protein